MTPGPSEASDPFRLCGKGKNVSAKPACFAKSLNLPPQNMPAFPFFICFNHISSFFFSMELTLHCAKLIPPDPKKTWL